MNFMENLAREVLDAFLASESEQPPEQSGYPGEAAHSPVPALFARIYPYCRVPGRQRQRVAEPTSP